MIKRTTILFLLLFSILLLTSCTLTQNKSLQKSPEPIEKTQKDVITESNELNELNQITISFSGDVMLGRLVNELIPIKKPEYFWGDLIGEIKKTDLSLINLECVITSNTEKWQKSPRVFYFGARPEAINILKSANIDFVSIANNHVLDFQEKGLLEMLELLDKNNIKHSGAGKNRLDAQKPVFFEIDGIKIGIISFADHPFEYKATETTPGINYIEIRTDKGISQIKNKIKEIKEIKEIKNTGADIVIFSIHWGPNMQQRPSNDFKEFARTVIDAGADIFYGTSAHLFQGVEIYNNKIIMYDTGDFIDDYYVDLKLRNDQTFLFKVFIDKKTKTITKLEMIPALISDFQVNKATGVEKEVIMNKMILLSEEMGTEVKKEDDKLIVMV